MNLDHRHLDRLDRVVDCDRGVGIAARVEQHCLGARDIGLMQPVDQRALVVRLPAFEAEAEAVGLRLQPRMDVVQRIMAIDFRLARAEQVEIGAAEDIDGGLVGQCTVFRLRRNALPLYGLLDKRQSEAETPLISIILNGDPRQVREGSIADLVASLGLDVKKVAVERNREIVPRSTLADVALAEGDALEIVHFVGGG